MSDKRTHLVVQAAVKVALERRAEETGQFLQDLVDDILRKALALPPDPLREPAVPAKLVPVVAYLKAVLEGRKGTRFDRGLLQALLDRAKEVGD